MPSLTARLTHARRYAFGASLVALILALVPFAADALASAERHARGIENPIPATMQAVRIQEFGGPEVLTLERVPVPTPGEGQVLVRVLAAGVNPVDWKIREGYFRDPSITPPLTPGYDISGEVVAVGAGVNRIQVGDEVFAYINLRAGGGYAEYAAINENEIALKPPSLSYVEAASVPLAALTAWQALFDQANLKAGQTVLIHAGAGGVGSFAVQIAKSRGARVIATASEANHAYLKELGADEVIDYRTQRFEELVKDVDVVLESIGGDTLERSYGVVRKGGIIVSIVGPTSQERTSALGIRGVSMLVQPSASQLAQIGSLIEQEKIKTTVSHTFNLDQAAEAHTQSQTGRTRGKIVLIVAPE